jgi:Fe-S-cluster-containing dehydrogenase component
MGKKQTVHGSPEVATGGLVSSMAQKTFTRRNFIKGIGVGGLGALIMNYLGCSSLSEQVIVREINTDDALGMVISLPDRCVGCRRCELACTEYNDGFSQPSMARINVRRNYNFGPRGAQLGFWRGEGKYGNFRIIQDTCRQCPHPTPCAMACPYGAIEIEPPANARVVNTDKCEGCEICQRACPWGMITFDSVSKKATKCFLCNNDPECVRACPAGALRYVPWEDLTKDIPARLVIPAAIQVPDDITCITEDCHPDFESNSDLMSSIQ